ncbi:MAG: ATP-dependent helicase [Bacteroidetes bacterium]|nr:MAG: ATP-dependent helicase [Bacteroidota bacterium]
MQTFEETGINPQIIKAVSELGFEKPTDIQKLTIPYLLEKKKDLVALAQTGTGKTAAFGLPILNQIDLETGKTQALILSPTRELCIQISNDIKAYSKYLKNIRIGTVYGGASADKQIAELNKGCQIVVGTPGRVLDLKKRKRLKIDHINYLVLDEADEMLDMGFKDDLDAILESTPEEKQTLLFSATMPKEISKIAKKYMNDADEISVGEKNMGAENVNHQYYLTKARDRFKALKRILDSHPNIYSIVFCRTRRDTTEVADKLIENGYNAEALHGDLSQAQRDYVMNRFRIKHLQILVATDVAARGLDVNDLTHVINYNVPEEPKIYIHRSGRTGRAGKTGTSVSLIHSREFFRLRDIEKKLGKKIVRKSIPGGKEICEKQLLNLIDKVEKIEIDEGLVEPFMDVIYKKLSWLSREELIKHFVSVEFNRFLSYYKDAPDLNINEDASEERRGKKGRSNRDKGDFSRFFINLGSKKKVSPAKIIGLINDQTQMRDINIGKIDILDSFSFFEVESKFEEAVLTGFADCKYKGMNVTVELSKDKKSSGKRPTNNKNYSKRNSNKRKRKH